MRTGCRRSSSSARVYSFDSMRNALAPGCRSRRSGSGSISSDADIANGLRRRHRRSEHRSRVGHIFFLHSLSHLLMAELAMECGYPASSLKEHIYALADENVGGAPLRCGILVYTASTGAQGTLGGLVAT